VCIYYQWVVLVVLLCSYKKVQNFSSILGPRKLRTSEDVFDQHIGEDESDQHIGFLVDIGFIVLREVRTKT
jgi:hypothetical protein